MNLNLNKYFKPIPKFFSEVIAMNSKDRDNIDFREKEELSFTSKYVKFKNQSSLAQIGVNNWGCKTNVGCCSDFGCCEDQGCCAKS